MTGVERVDPIVLELQTRIFREMSAERKLALADDLLVLARELKLAGLRMQHPDLPDDELRRRVTELIAHVAR